jgi:lipopolysaccharide transport system ATP-binding protein
MSTVIKVENLSKQYRLGQVGTGTISHDVNRWWHKIRGKEDPYLKIGESNDRTVKGDSDYVWALKDINFEVKQGEVLGIIGRNGAGKSTLLKILSRTTSPTSGSIKIKGRVASLLEVGTGFHPELSGRDNIFLNGAILGMVRGEIQSNFDEIVDFAGVERYIDTPVKRYSSGMYVRLAFAVAAHLEPEILIVDEVLAVGDIEFQKKCLGKMREVSVKNGRTVLLVSHNFKAVTALCENSILLDKGKIDYVGDTGICLQKYYEKDNEQMEFKVIEDKQLIKFIGISNSTELVNHTVIDDLRIVLKFASNNYSSKNVFFDIGIFNERGDMVIHSKTKFIGNSLEIKGNKIFEIIYTAAHPCLSPGRYSITIYLYEERIEKIILLWIEDIPQIIIKATNPFSNSVNTFYLDEVNSIIFPKTDIKVIYD